MRRGFTLIELLVVMAAASTVFTVLAVSIHVLYRLQADVQDESQRGAALHRFASQLREDAHAAADASVVQDADAEQTSGASESLLLVGGDGALSEQVLAEGALAGGEGEGAERIVYDLGANGSRIRRRVLRGQETLHRDSFALPQDATVRWEITPEGASKVVTVVVSRPVGKEPNDRRVYRTMNLEAAVGLDQLGSGESTSQSSKPQ